MNRNQGSVNGGFQTVVRVLWGNEIPLPPSYLNLTSFLPQFCLFLTFFLPLFNLNLTSASSRISNHGLETTVYRLLAKPSEPFFRNWNWNGAPLLKLSSLCRNTKKPSPSSLQELSKSRIRSKRPIYANRCHPPMWQNVDSLKDGPVRWID